MSASIIVLVLFVAAMFSGMFSCEMAVALLLCAVLIPAFDILISAIRIKRPLEIKTPDGSNEPFHPSVMFFREGWNGYRYWMAFTPYPVFKPPYRDRWECPCVVTSNDGVRWNYPGKFEFLDDLTQEQIESFGYFSDTHLTYDNRQDKLYCYYRLNEGRNPGTVTIFRRETVDGKQWSERTPLVYPQDVERLEPLSQCVLRQNNDFYMWYVAHRGDPNGIYMVKSTDGLYWNDNRKCTLLGAKVRPWHIDVQYIEGNYYLVVYELSQRISLWKSADGEKFSFVRVLLTIPGFGNCGLFYNNILYRACLVKTDKDYKLYFACGSKNKNGLGLLKGDRLSALRVVSLTGNKPYKMLFYDVLSKYTYIERIIFHRVKRIIKE